MTVESVDYIFLQYYFDENEQDVDINAPHDNAKRLKKPHRRTKESVKDAFNIRDKLTKTNLNTLQVDAVMKNVFSRKIGEVVDHGLVDSLCK